MAVRLKCEGPVIHQKLSGKFATSCTTKSGWSLRKERALIWRLLANYVNGDKEANFEEVVLACVHHNGYYISLGAGGLPPTLEYKEIRLGLTWKAVSAKYRPAFHGILQWLVRPNCKIGEPALSFLWKHAKFIVTTAQISGNKSLEYREYLIDSGSAASPLCKFILECIDRHNQKEESIPLAACQVCGKFIAVERLGRKRYCSKNCGVKAFYRTHGGAAAYMQQLRQNPMFKKKFR